MGNVPVRRDHLAKQLEAFIVWLNDYGAEIGKPTNPYEVIRYRAYSVGDRKASTHIVYTKDNGLLTWTGKSMDHFLRFLAGDRPEGSMRVPTVTVQPSESPSAQRRRLLLERDGDECWFCGKAMGSDITIEHLVPRSKGGVNHLDNYALAHRQCNADAADLPLVEKIEMRSRLRTPTAAAWRAIR